MIAPIGCANRALGTMLAIRNPIDRMLIVANASATTKFATRTSA